MRMPRGVVLALATFALIGAAGAQTHDPNAPTGPHSPNPPRNTPDLTPAPPCGPATNLASNQVGMAPGTPSAAQAPEKSKEPSAAPHTGVLADTQCATKGPTGQALPPPSAAGPHP